MAYNEATAVTLTWSNPVLWPKGVESDALVSHIDHLPTMLDFLDIDASTYNLPGTRQLNAYVYTDVCMPDMSATCMLAMSGTPGHALAISSYNADSLLLVCLLSAMWQQAM